MSAPKRYWKRAALEAAGYTFAGITLPSHHYGPIRHTAITLDVSLYSLAVYCTAPDAWEVYLMPLWKPGFTEAALLS